jgi:hypothetical protein
MRLFQKPQQLNQTGFQPSHNCFVKATFLKVTAHNSFSKSHNPTKHTLRMIPEICVCTDATEFRCYSKKGEEEKKMREGEGAVLPLFEMMVTPTVISICGCSVCVRGYYRFIQAGSATAV